MSRLHQTVQEMMDAEFLTAIDEAIAELKAKETGTVTMHVNGEPVRTASVTVVDARSGMTQRRDCGAEEMAYNPAQDTP